MKANPTRIDYYDDPDAPTPTSRVPGASVVVERDGHVLMIKRSDSGLWSLPGGAHDIGESLPQTAVRECLEETGITVEIIGLVGTFTNPRNVFEFRTDRPEVRQEFSILFSAQAINGKPTTSPESEDVRWIPIDELDQLPTTKAIANRIRSWRRYATTSEIHIG